MTKRVFVKNIDVSQAALNFNLSPIALELLAGEQIRFEAYKPFRRVHVEIVGAVSDTLTVKYFAGTWKTLSIKDFTFNFNRSGFIEFTPPTDWQKIDGYYPITFEFAGNIETTLHGINFLFSNDDDLREEMAFFDNYLQKTGLASLISFHQGALTQIIDEFNRSGAVKGKDKDRLVDLDFLIPDELRQASKFLALSKMFFELSDSVDDKYYQKHKDYESLYSAAKNTYYLTIDENDDGVMDQKEKNKIRTITVTRL